MRLKARCVLGLFGVACAMSVCAEDRPIAFSGETLTVYKQLMVLPDPEARLTIEDASSQGLAGRFVAAPAFSGKLGKSGTYWVRLALDNATSAPRDVAIFPAAQWNEARLYTARNGEFTSSRSGLLVPAAERGLEIGLGSEYPFPFFAVRAELAPSAVTVLYLRLSADWRFGTMPYLFVEVHDLAQLREEERSERLAEAIFVGVTLALGLYHLLLLLALRDASYGYYVLHISGMTLFVASAVGLSTEYLWPAHPAWTLYALPLGKLAATVGLAMFAHTYLDARQMSPRLDLALRAFVAASLVLAAALPVIAYDQLAFFVNWAFLGLFVLAFSTGVVAQFRGSLMARYFLAGNAFTVLGLAVSIMSEARLVPAWGRYGAQVGVSLEALLLSRGLAFRYNLMRSELADRALSEERQRREREEERRHFLEKQKQELEQTVAERTQDLSRERERSEALLRNILPVAVAEELKRHGHSEPRRHEDVTIIFTDFVGFTQTVATLPPQRMVEELNEIFRGFDGIVDHHGLEKIKTIGDAYMAAAGVPEPQKNHAARCVDAALEMQRWLRERNAHSSIKWELRLGIHSGSVVVGVVGNRKYAYDIWGDTVNIASRMESSGAAGRVNVSAYTYDLIRDLFDCEYRGKVAAKGKGEIDMYFVLARKPAAP